MSGGGSGTPKIPELLHMYIHRKRRERCASTTNGPRLVEFPSFL